MGKASDYIVDKNKLKGGSDTAKGLYFGGTAQQAYLGSKLVFNRALYSIEAFDILIPAEGTENMKGTCLVDSFKTDRDGKQTSVDYTISPTSIEANETDEEKTGFYTVTQNVSGLKTTGQYTQAAKVLLGYTYHGLKVTSVTYMYAPASGGFITPVVGYSGTRRAVYSNGETEDESWGSNTSVLLSATGKALVTGAVFDSKIDIGKVLAPDLGTTPSEIRAVAQITALTIEAIDGSILSWSGTAYAYQFENVRTTTYSTPVVTASYTDISAGGSAAVLTITWSQTKTESYSSGADPVETPLSGTIDNAATSGNRITSISGTRHLTGASLVTTSGSASRGNITANSLEYTSKERTKAYDVSVTVSINGKSATKSVTVYQAANVVSSYYTTPEITSVTAGDVGAGGAAASISVKYTQSLVTISTAKPSGKSSEVGGTKSPATVMGETVSNNGAKSGVKIVADSLGSTVKSRSIVYTVLSVSITANEKTGLWSGELDVYQAANAVTKYERTSYTVNISANPTTGVNSAGGTSVLTCNAIETLGYYYTSDPDNIGSYKSHSMYGNLKTNIGTLSTNQIIGTGKQATLTLGENTGIERTATVTMTATSTVGQTDIVVSCTVKQNAVRYSFYSNTLAAIGASGGEMVLLIFSTRNDKAFPITASNIAVSGITGTSVAVDVADSTTGEYKVTVSGIGANTSTSQRTFTVTATQPSSGKTVTWDAIQSGASQIKGKVSVVCTPQFTNNTTFERVSYTIYFDATNTTYYTGGTISNVYVQLNTKNDGTGTVIANTKIYDSLQVAAGSKSASKLGTLTNSTGSSSVYFLVYYDNALQYKTMPMLKPELQ